MKKQEYIKFFAALAAVLAVYVPVFIWMVGRWMAPGTYYSHGFLVPFISAFLVWLRREDLSRSAFSPSNPGWALFIGGLLVYAISALWQVYFSAGFSLLPVIFGLILVLLGKEFFRPLFFPVAFLAFMIPLPMVAISNLSFRLKIFASQVSVFIVNAMGMRAVRDGSTIRTAHSYLLVEDPCSGIRSLIALIALGTLMAYLSRLSRSKKIILFLSSMPIAVFSNVIRIVALTLVSEVYGVAAATGKFHDAMGIVVFVIAFLSLALVKKVME